MTCRLMIPQHWRAAPRSSGTGPVSGLPRVRRALSGRAPDATPRFGQHQLSRHFKGPGEIPWRVDRCDRPITTDYRCIPPYYIP